jgi:hypothetical protein
MYIDFYFSINLLYIQLGFTRKYNYSANPDMP